jgi:two-component system OmpR family response regulator
LALKAFVVEDNRSIRESLIEALAELAGVETAGYASTEAAAVAWLRDPANAWDVAIIDLVLEPRGGSGLGVLRALAERAPHQKVVVLTGAAGPEMRRMCESLHCDHVFDKSMETEDLLDWCRALAQHHTP